MNRFFLSIVLIGSSLIFGVFVALPRFQEFSAVSKELNVKRAELESRESYFAHLKDLQDRINSEELVAKIDAAIPNDPQLPALHDFLQSTAAGSGLSLRSITASQGALPQGARLQRVSASLQLGGSYEGLKVFLSSLLRASRMTDVESINFSSPQAGTGFVFNIRTSSYSY
ncbi:MAG: type 4a pilus biogenesis protein PilO [bacterium]|nr:type 4a pilus biogenesis protein PilO [bacterium]